MEELFLVNKIIRYLGPNEHVTKKRVLIGKENYIIGYVIYIQGLTDITSIDDVILKPLMQDADESKFPKDNVLEFLSDKYITRGDTLIEHDISAISKAIIRGFSAIIVDGFDGAILVNTKGGEFRSITDPATESPIRGSREGFVEDMEVNASILKRILKDENLKSETFVVGKRTKTDVLLMYIEDILDEEILKEVRKRINNINVDGVLSSGILEQYIEDSPYSPFPQMYGTEKPDKVASKLLEGRFVLFVSGTPYALTSPSIFIEFMTAPEDYYERTMIGSIIRLIRYGAVLLILLLSPVYLSLISYNVELIPITFIMPIAQSRQGVPLSPLFEILFMEIIVELIREGGLRLPPKVASTISIVSGVIIGNAAIESKVVSPTTLLVVGSTTVASFVIPNYEMATTLRILRYPMLILADALGFLGVAIGCFIFIGHLMCLKSFNTPYFEYSRHDFEDFYIRFTLWKMRERPSDIPIKQEVRQGNSAYDTEEGDQ